MAATSTLRRLRRLRLHQKCQFKEGFSNLGQYQVCLFLLFLTTYLLTLTGNMLIILIVRYNSQLHTPMYFFITILSILDIWYIYTTVPKLLTVMVTHDTRISFQWCFAQLYLFHSLGITECNLLAAMAFDRCMAICNPLRYTTIMSVKMCRCLASVCWFCGFMTACIPITLTARVPFCGPYHLNHFFCDIAPLLRLACIEIPLTVSVNGFVGGFTALSNLAIVIIMYLGIIVAIIKIKSNTGRSKAFSTCSSHLIVVTLFYGCASSVYSSPKGSRPAASDKMLALVYTMFTPLFNPIIYSFKNKAVKEAMKNGIQKFQSEMRCIQVQVPKPLT
ncbi:olfactory receptor 6N1-like [Pelobates cultripes]|uniref:Olfactory receptor n=1 Tax=Pelobates cultripes TaxID=61616 RepID=A0AAD1TGH9_PELCU|nr:olfactory receptor 6N1-like [Pelobates cultripes]